MTSNLRRFFLRILSLLRLGRAEQELGREIASHLRLLEDRLIAEGMTASAARAEARRVFGGVEQAKEHQRDARSFRWLAGWPMDLKLGVRMLVKSPGLTAVAVVALSFAIGAGAAYLEIVNDFFRPTLPLANRERLVGIHNHDLASGRPDPRLSHDFRLWRQAVQSIEHLGAHTPFERNLITADGRSEPVKGVEISASAFRIVPTPPLLGRPLTSDDELPNAPPVVLIGQSLWQQRLGGDTSVVGHPVRLGNTIHTIVGIMPADFGFPVNHRLWVPLRQGDAGVQPGEGPPLRVFGQLAPGASVESAQSEIEALTSNVAGDEKQVRPRVGPYLDSILVSGTDDGIERAILYSVNIFFVGLLSICGATVATLVFARTATREGEITVRTALGASRGRIVAQLFAEALVLTSVATAVGLLAASAAVRLVSGYAVSQGAQLPFWWDDDLAPATVAYAAALTLFAAAIIGVIPALKATGAEMQARLKQAAAGGSGMKFGRLWTGVIVTQVACTVIFLLSVVSLGWNATAGSAAGAHLRFTPEEFLTVRLEMDQETGPAEFKRRFLSTYQEIERHLETDGAVAGVTYATHLPNTSHAEFWVELDGIESASRPDEGPLWVRSTFVAADAFETFAQPIVRGRSFTAAEIENGLPVAIVDETFARLIFGAREPIGQRLRQPQSSERERPGPWLDIVGVVKDVANTSGASTEDAVIYRPGAPGRDGPVHMVVRTRGNAQAIAQRVATMAAAAGPAVRLYDIQTLDAVYRTDGIAYAMMARALAVVGAVALLLATAGVYSLLSFTLARRTREIGIRTALGAAPREIVTAIFARAFGQIGLGVLLGSIPGTALVAFGAPEVARGGGASVAAAAAACVAGLIVVIAVFACVVPARRALRIQPTEALRAE